MLGGAGCLTCAVGLVMLLVTDSEVASAQLVQLKASTWLKILAVSVPPPRGSHKSPVWAMKSQIASLGGTGGLLATSKNALQVQRLTAHTPAHKHTT